MRTGRRFLYRPSEAGWVKWASAVDDWMSNTFVILNTEFGDIAVEKFVNDAGMKDVSYPDIPLEFQQRMRVLNRRLQNSNRELVNICEHLIRYIKSLSEVSTMTYRFFTAGS
jgi:hypothetical protein